MSGGLRLPATSQYLYLTQSNFSGGTYTLTNKYVNTIFINTLSAGSYTINIATDIQSDSYFQVKITSNPNSAVIVMKKYGVQFDVLSLLEYKNYNVSFSPPIVIAGGSSGGGGGGSSFITFYPISINDSITFAALDMLAYDPDEIKSFPMVTSGEITGYYLSLAGMSNLNVGGLGETLEVTVGYFDQGDLPSTGNFNSLGITFTLSDADDGTYVYRYDTGLTVSVAAGQRLAVRLDTSTNFNDSGQSRYIMNIAYSS